MTSLVQSAIEDSYPKIKGIYVDQCILKKWSVVHMRYSAQDEVFFVSINFLMRLHKTALRYTGK